MKKISMLILSVLLPLLGSTAATSTLSIEPLSIGAGETKTMLIDLNNPDQQVTMVEFRMQLPQGLTVASGDDALDIAGRTTWQKHTLYMNEQDGLTHIMLASPSNALVSGTSGVLLSIRLTASSTFNGGTVTLKKQKIGSPDMTVSTPADYSYTVQTPTPPQPDAEPYAVYNNGTLTFYCDNQRSSRQGTTYDLNEGFNYPGWYENRESITKAVFDTSFANARPTTTYSWFYGCHNLTEFQGMEHLNTSSVTNMNSMFRECTNLAAIDLSHFNTANAEGMGCMFQHCRHLEALDLSSFNTEKLIDVNCMFFDCRELATVNLSSFNTSSVKYFSNMFQYCYKLTELDLSNFNTANADESFNSLFAWCNELAELKLGSGFVSTDSQDCSDAFRNCRKLARVTYTGDIPSSINSTFFEGVGKASSPVTLDVPTQYRANYAAKFDGNKFYGGYFTLGGGDQPSPQPGDLNGDGKVNAADLMELVDIIMGREGRRQGDDLNGDGKVNAADLMELVDKIMKK